MDFSGSSIFSVADEKHALQLACSKHSKQKYIRKTIHSHLSHETINLRSQSFVSVLTLAKVQIVTDDNETYGQSTVILFGVGKSTL